MARPRRPPARPEEPRHAGPAEQLRRRERGAGHLRRLPHAGFAPANEAVVVTCRVSDADGIASVNLRYRVDPAALLTTVAMRDDGAGGDAAAGDGIYSATISGRGAGTLVAFRVQSSDANAAAAATTTFPAAAPAQECLVRWGDTVPVGSFAHYHLWNTQAVDGQRSSALNNTYRDSTLVHGDLRVIYNVGFRDKGSPFHGGGGSDALTNPEDERFWV